MANCILALTICPLPKSEFHTHTHKQTQNQTQKFPQKRQRNKPNARFDFGIRVKCLSCFGGDPLRLHATETKKKNKIVWHQQ